MSNGNRTAAIEVKSLTGDGEWNDYDAYFRSLQRSLAPSGEGHWILNPPSDFRLPMDRPTRRRVKSEIQRLSSSMRPGAVAAVRIPRHAGVVGEEGGPGSVHCCHTFSGRALFARASALVSGRFMLIDPGEAEHSFVTDACRDAFVGELVAACQRRVHDGVATARWPEEWELTRGDDGDGQVDLIVVTNAREVWSVNAEAVDLVLDDALRKFRGRWWADYHLIVLDREGGMLDASLVIDAVRGYGDDALKVADLILVAQGEHIGEAWCAPELR